MAKVFTPLAPNVPIVDKDGKPTPYFARILQELSDTRISESVADELEVITDQIEALEIDDLADVDTTGVSDGDALVYDEDLLTWVPGAGGGGGSIQLLQSQTASASATLDFTGFVDAAYDAYIFEFINIVPATNATNLWVRYSTNGGSSYDSSLLYDFAGHQTSTGTFQGATNAGASQAQGILVSSMSNTADTAISGRATLYAPSANKYKAIVGQFSAFKSDSNYYMHNVSGRYRSTTAVNAVRFMISSGNITSGTIRVYGVANS